MKEIREIFETVRTYCGMMFGDAKLDAKMPRCEDAKSVTGVTESLLAPMAGEESSSLRTVVSIRNAGARENQKETIQSNPSPEFLNSLSFIKKFYPVLNLLVTSLALYEYAPAFTLCSLVLHAPRVPQKQRGCSLLHLLAIRTRCTPSVRKFAALHWGEGKVTKVAHDNNFNSLETDHTSMPLGIIASKLVSLSDWQIRPTATHNSLKKAAFTLAEVLITLGIIGVVAALTLPTLIQNHQKQVYVTQLKKAYSTLGNAFNKMAVDEGVVDWKQTYCANLSMDSSNSEIQSCLNNFAKTVKVIKTTKLGFGKYSDNFVMNDNIDTALVLEDGTTYNFLVYGCGFYGDIIVDVNGLEKGSNQYGRDIFQFNIDYDNNKVVPTGTASWNPDVWKSCSATNLSTLCTVKVLIEGKMNY